MRCLSRQGVLAAHILQLQLKVASQMGNENEPWETGIWDQLEAQGHAYLWFLTLSQ